MKDCFTKQEKEQYKIKDMTSDQKIALVNSLIKDTKNSKRQSRLQAIVLNKALLKIKFHPKGSKAGLKAFLYTDRYEMSGTSGLEAKINAINSNAHNKIYDIMEEFMPRKWGLMTNKKSQVNFAKALFGEAVGDTRFTNFAKDWADLIEELKVRFNKAGGAIDSVDDIVLPTHHDENLVGKNGFEEWYKDIEGLIDVEKMDFEGTFTKDVFKSEYDNIVSGGYDRFEPGKYYGKGKMANRHNEKRFFKFKDSESWLKYHEKYSDGTIYTLMMDHVTMISNEIGMMENLGPNPDAGFKFLADTVRKDYSDKNAAAGAEKAWANISGKTSPANRRWADRMQTLRNFEVGIKLPGAALSALPDVIFNGMTARYNGIPAMKTLTRFVSNLGQMISKGESAKARKLASELWQPLEMMLDEAHSAMRFSDVAGHKGSARFASAILRGSGLNAWTVAGKMAFHAEFMSSLAKDFRSNKNMMRTFERYGIDFKDMQAIERSKKMRKGNIDYLDPSALPRNTAEKIVAMVVSETKYAIPEGDALVRSTLNQGTQKGTLGGEILRAGTMFKNFPVTIIANHWARTLNGNGGNTGEKIGYFSTMMVGTWLLGTTVFQLKEIAKGREPVDWDNKELWLEGAKQAGIASIMGDIMSSDSRGYGGSVADFVAGPIGSDANRILWKGILGSMDDMKKGEAGFNDIVKKTVGGIPNYVPGQMWYTKLIMERAFLDSMRKFGDPKYELKKSKRDAKRKQKFQNERWY